MYKEGDTMFYGYAIEMSDQAFRILIIILGVGFPGALLLLKVVQDTMTFQMRLEESYQKAKHFYDLMWSSLGLMFFALIIHLTIHMEYPTIFVDTIIAVIFISAIGVALYGARYYNTVQTKDETNDNI